MGSLRTLLFLPCLGALVGCAVCPDVPPGEPVAPACQFTPEQKALHEQMVRERQQRNYELLVR